MTKTRKKINIVSLRGNLLTVRLVWKYLFSVFCNGFTHAWHGKRIKHAKLNCMPVKNLYYWVLMSSHYFVDIAM